MRDGGGLRDAKGVLGSSTCKSSWYIDISSDVVLAEELNTLSTGCGLRDSFILNEVPGGQRRTLVSASCFSAYEIYGISARNDCGPKSPFDKPRGLTCLQREKEKRATAGVCITQLAKTSIDPD